MKKSVQLQIITIVLLVVVAVVDAIAVFVPITAVVWIFLILFKPKWFQRFVNNLYS